MGCLDSSMVSPMDEYEFRADLPKHVQISAILAVRIRANILKPGMPIPSETSLMQEFGVARVTIRKAVASLRDSGYIRTVHGMGSFVSDPADWPEKLSLTALPVRVANRAIPRHTNGECQFDLPPYSASLASTSPRLPRSRFRIG